MREGEGDEGKQKYEGRRMKKNEYKTSITKKRHNVTLSQDVHIWKPVQNNDAPDWRRPMDFVVVVCRNPARTAFTLSLHVHVSPTDRL